MRLINTIKTDLSEHRYLFLITTIFWTLHLVIFWSNSFSEAFPVPTEAFGSDVLWLAALLCNALALFVFCFFLTRIKNLSYRFLSYASGLLIGVGIVLISLNILFPESLWDGLYLAGTLLLGVGTGLFMACLGNILSKVVPRITFVCTSAAFCAGSLIYLVLTLALVQYAIWVVVVLLSGLMVYFYGKELSGYQNHHEEPNSFRRAEKKGLSFGAFACLVFVIGLTAGVMRGFNQSPILPAFENYVFIATVFVSSLLLLGVSGVIDKFRPTLLLQIVVILIVGAFILLAVITREATAAFVLHTAGFLCFVVLVWFFCAYYSGRNDQSAQVFSLGLLANQSGQALGTLLFVGAARLYGSSDSFLLYLSLAVVYLVFVVALVYFANASRVKSKGSFAVALPEAEQAVEALAATYQLTPREKEIALQIVQGKNRQAMAEHFSVSQETIKTHTKHLYQKVGIHSKEELLAHVHEAAKEKDIL